MALDVFSPRDLNDLADLARTVNTFNAGQQCRTSRGMYAEVTIYRDGEIVAELTQHSAGDEETEGGLVLDISVAI